MAEDYPDFEDIDALYAAPPVATDARARIRAAIENAKVMSDRRGEPETASGKAGEPEIDVEAGEPEIDEDEDDPEFDDEGGDAPPTQGGDEAYSVERMNRDYAVVLLGSAALILKEIESGPIDDQKRFLKVEAFKILFGNRHVERRGPDGKVKTMSWANAWLLSEDRRDYQGVEFFPDPNNAPGTPRYLNLWRGFAFAPLAKANGYKTFRDHLLTNICGGDEKLFAWVFTFFAHIVQRPRDRPGVALVLRGGMGTGKTIVGEILGALFPAHYFLVDDPRYVTGNFNAHMASCLLLQADEAVWAGDKAAEGRPKGLITSPIQSIEAKGIDPIRLPNYVRLIMTSNESWVVPAGKDERRFAVLDVDPRCAGNHDYFAEMRAELRAGGYAALLHDLLAFDLESVDFRTIPKTSALLDQKERSLESVPSWWLGRLESGQVTRHSEGWDSEIEKYALYSDYIGTSEKIGVKRRAEETIFHRELKKITPRLRECRRSKAVADENGRLKETRPHMYIMPPLGACRAFWDDRMGQKRNWPEDAAEPFQAGDRESEPEF